MSRKFVSILIALCMCVSLVACGSSDGSDDPREGAVDSSASEAASSTPDST